MKFLSFSSRKPRKLISSTIALTVIVPFCLLVFTETLHSTANGMVCVKDDLGRDVRLSVSAKRVVSLAPSLTETVFALGAGTSLVGRTARCNFPREALCVQEIGSYLNPDPERILSLNPDLVLASRAGLRDELVQRLALLGIPVFIDDSGSLDDICALVRRLGVLLGKDVQADHLVRGFEKRRQEIRKKITDTRSPSVLFAVGVRPLVVAGGKSFLGALVREAGGLNIAEKETSPFPRFSIEEVIKTDPDFILILDKECRDKECLDHLKRYPSLTAVHKFRVYSMDADLMARPTPRILDGLEMMVSILHPELRETEREPQTRDGE